MSRLPIIIFIAEVEYSLDKAPPPLSLAQRLGLVEAPPRLLEEHIWTNIKAASNVRQDSTQPCPICQEDFGLSAQVSMERIILIIIIIINNDDDDDDDNNNTTI